MMEGVSRLEIKPMPVNARAADLSAASPEELRAKSKDLLAMLRSSDTNANGSQPKRADSVNTSTDDLEKMTLHVRKLLNIS